MDQQVSLQHRRIDLADAEPFVLGEARIDPAAHEAIIADRHERIQPQTMKVLVALHDRCGELVGREELIERCWDGRIVGEDVINRSISLLRRFATSAGGFAIETVPKAGYRLVETSARAKLSSPRMVVAAVLLTLAVGGGWLVRSDRSDTPTLIIESTSPNPASTAAARELGVKLASIETTNLSRFRLIGPRGPAEPPDLKLQVNGANGGDTSTVDLSLAHGKEQTVLWASHFEQPRENAGNLLARASVAATLALSCALEALPAHPETLSSQALRVYVRGCVRLAGEFDETSAMLAPLFEEVTAQAPHFAPAWDKLLYAESLATNFDAGPELLATIKRHLQTSRRFGINVPSGAMAEAALLPRTHYRSRIRVLELGSTRHPRAPALELALAATQMDVGRQNDAIAHATRAAALDPFSPATRGAYIWILAHSGRAGEARHQLDEAERLWPGTPTIQSARLTFELRYGDPHRALAAIQEGAARFNAASVTAFAQARMNPTKANVDRAVLEAMKFYRQQPHGLSGVVQSLAQFGRTPEAVDTLIQFRGQGKIAMRPDVYFRPMMRDAWRDPRFIQAMARWGVVIYWRQTGNWPDFCFDPQLPYDCKVEAEKLSA